MESARGAYAQQAEQTGRPYLSEATELSDDADGGDLLADVPRDRREEVQEILEELRRGVPGGGFGGISELRQWMNTFNHITGFSREATVQLCEVMARCLVVTRPDNAASSTGDLQQTFVRMGGVKNIVDALVARLSDTYVVAGCLRVLSAICQGSPVAAQDLQDEGNTIRLLLRTIERHAADDDVALSGCSLIGHLCAPLSSPGARVIQTFSASHRSGQRALAEAGALDLLLDLITANGARVSELASQAEELQNRAVRAGQLVPKKGADNAKGKVERVKAGMEMRQLWERYHEEEAAAARIQEAALHALTLIATGNEPTTRMVVGALGCWQRLRQREAELAALEEEGGSRPGSRASGRSRASGASSASGASRASRARSRKSARSQRSGSGLSGSSRSSASGSRRSTKDSVRSLDVVIPEGDARHALTTLESFAGSLALVVEVLRGAMTRDRPPLAARACRLLTVIAKHQQGLLERLLHESEAQARELEVRLRRDPAKLEDRKPEAPFAPLQPLLAALTHAMRSHLSDAPLLTAALEAVAQLREVALLAAPAGVQPRGEEAKAHWRRLLAEAEEAGEFRAAGQVLQRALHSTQVADQRISNFRVSPHELVGDGVWLTPRMREATRESSQHADRLAGEIVAAAWQNGDPERVSRRLGGGTGKGPRRDSSAPGGRRSSRDSMGDFGSPAPSAQSSKEQSAFMGADAGPPKEDMAFVRKNYERALGYFEHSEEDFDRVWRGPLTEILGRNFSCPEIKGRSEQARAPDSIDELMRVQFLQSSASKLRARAVVQPRNKWHQKVSEQRVRDLEDGPGISQQVAMALSKDLRKAGYVLPKYGFQVTVIKGRRESLLPQAENPAEEGGAALPPAA